MNRETGDRQEDCCFLTESFLFSVYFLFQQILGQVVALLFSSGLNWVMCYRKWVIFSYTQSVLCLPTYSSMALLFVGKTVQPLVSP